MEPHSSPGPVADGDTGPPHDDDVVELRLALVCYGGVSLAVYMHGITKELHKLVLASDALDHGGPAPDGSTDAVYAGLIDRLAAMPRRNGASAARTRVVIDIVAGTSAGGINGVCLARALAQDASQEAIRDLWIEHADIATLLQPGAPSLVYEAWPHVARAWPGARDAIPAPDEEPAPAGEGLFERLRRRLRDEADDAGDVLRDLAALGDAPPSLLRGEILSQRVHSALAAMPARDGGRGTLMPPGHELELFVTATDLAGVAQRVLVTGQVVADMRHRHVMVFRRSDGGPNQFTDEHVPVLSFAARATSSFPAAFRPISLSAFAADVGDAGRDWGPDIPHFFRPYVLDGLSADDVVDRWFVDGGVLDNKPFDHAVSAIRRRRADHEVRRCLLYVEPDPGALASAGPPGAPSAVRTMYRAASTIPLEQSILQQVLELRDLNERARRLAEVVSDQAADLADDEGWDEAMGRPQAAAGAEDPVYRRLRIRGVVDAFAQTACRACDYPVESNHAFFVREIVRCWARRRGLFEPGERGLSAPAEQFLSDFDVGYTRRRLRFLIDGVSSLYAHAGTPGHPSRRQLDAAKRSLYDRVDELDRLVAEASADASLAGLLLDRFSTAAVSALFPPERLDPAYDLDATIDRFVRETDLDALHDALRDYLCATLAGGSLDAFAATIFGEFVQGMAGWTLPPEARTALLGRFARFATWDPLTYPIRVLSDVGERDVVEVMRMSPSEALLLGAGSADDKLRGTSVHHFGAFFRASWRQQDYLWGRLDAAEQLIRLLVADVADQAARPALEREGCRIAFAAILDEEEPALPAAGELVAELRTRLASV